MGVRLHQHIELTKAGGEVILTADDGYRWVRIASDISKGGYKPSDDVLSPASQLPAVPLISRAVSYVSEVSGLSVENTGSLLTVFLSGLFIFPLGFFFYYAGYPTGGIGAGLLGAMSFAYLSRTSAFQIDTDMLNLFFLSMGALAVLMAERGRAVLWSAVLGVTMYAFWLWYFHSGFTLFYFVLLLYALRKQDSKTIVLSASVYILLASPFIFVNGLGSILFFASGTSGYPVYADVAELEVLSFTQTMSYVAAYWWLGVLGVLLSLMVGRKVLFLAAFYLLGAMAFSRGIRFSMFLAPLCGAGIGMLFDKCLPRRCVFGYALVIAVIMFVPAYNNISVMPPAVMDKGVYNFIKKLNLTEENAMIATLWDKGFAIEHLAGRRVLSDGASQYKKGAKLYAEAMMQTDERRTAEILSEAAGGRPLYLLFTPDMDRKVGGLVMTAGYKAEKSIGGVILTGIDNPERVSFSDTVYFKLHVIGDANIECFSKLYADGGALRLYKLNNSCLNDKNN